MSAPENPGVRAASLSARQDTHQQDRTYDITMPSNETMKPFYLPGRLLLDRNPTCNQAKKKPGRASAAAAAPVLPAYFVQTSNSANAANAGHVSGQMSNTPPCCRSSAISVTMCEALQICSAARGNMRPHCSRSGSWLPILPPTTANCLQANSLQKLRTRVEFHGFLKLELSKVHFENLVATLDVWRVHADGAVKPVCHNHV